MNMCWVALAWGTCARLVELQFLLWLSFSARTRVSMCERAKIPSELLAPLSLFLEDTEMPSGDGQKML